MSGARTYAALGLLVFVVSTGWLCAGARELSRLDSSCVAEVSR